MSNHLSQKELESYLWGAATLLRGLIDASDYKQYIFPLLFFKRLSDVWDEDYREAFEDSQDEGYATATANDRFTIPEGAHWKATRDASRDVGRALLNAYQAIEAANQQRLQGVFGNAAWTDKAQMPDETLKNLIEHFSKHTLSLANVPEDELGNGYEYLIKQFADDSGHTAQEFYTNRTLVHLMAQMLEPKAGETIYDPTCGTGGMLISCLAEVKRNGGDTRTIGLYGQELINITAAIARMNLVLHGVSDFDIRSGNTLHDPALIAGDHLKSFDVVLANPPYSIKKWNREAWQSDKWGRNFLGTPPQGRADYAFFQHILKSMDPKRGRCAILFPHGVLFRKAEANLRRNLVATDMVECVLGLGPASSTIRRWKPALLFAAPRSPRTEKARRSLSTPFMRSRERTLRASCDPNTSRRFSLRTNHSRTRPSSPPLLGWTKSWRRAVISRFTIMSLEKPQYRRRSQLNVSPRSGNTLIQPAVSSGWGWTSWPRPWTVSSPRR